jgi:hypothetical protein
LKQLEMGVFTCAAAASRLVATRRAACESATRVAATWDAACSTDKKDCSTARTSAAKLTFF